MNQQGAFAELKKHGVDEVWFSSTSSCIFCHESPCCPKDEKTSAPSARDLQNAIHEEMRGSVEVAAELGVKANVLFWIVPDFFRAWWLRPSAKLPLRRLSKPPFKHDSHSELVSEVTNQEMLKQVQYDNLQILHDKSQIQHDGHSELV